MRSRSHLRQNGLMAAMYAIKVANGQRTGGPPRKRRGRSIELQQGFHVREFTILDWLALEYLILSDLSPTKRRLVILISGRGSNMQALVQACRNEAWPAEVCAVIASRPDAAGLQWAREQGLATSALYHKDFPGREAFDAALAEEIDQYQPDYVLLAGFMRVLTPGFVNHYAGRLVNIHPSLLPMFPGLHTHAQALATGVQVHGCTVHFVTPVLDHGPIIAQGCVAVRAGDTPDNLASRVLSVEHLAYPAAARWLVEGRVRMTADHRVEVDGDPQRLFFDPEF